MSLVNSQLEAERVTKPGGPGEPSEHEEVGAVTKALCHWKLKWHYQRHQTGQTFNKAPFNFFPF